MRTPHVFARSLPSALLTLFTALLGTCDPSAASDGSADLGVRVADGFVVEQFADDDLAHDIYTLTFDPHGEVVVAGEGYIRRLSDRDGDGVADTGETVADFPQSGAMGLCFFDDSLYVTGDGGLWQLADDDHDGRFEPGEKLLTLGGGEHGAHAVQVGPDGWLYVICGNGAGVGAAHVTSPASPITDPHAGTVVRVSPDHERVEVVADGFRNCYDFAFARFGELVAYDSDGERVHHLPWYTPTRLFDVACGRSHGWLYGGWSNSWSRPEYFFDNVTRLATFGRGSPTGVAIYRHDRFPPAYRNGVFAACWTFGRICFVPLARDGATLAGKSQIFLESTGHNGFAPVAVAVGPVGDLWIAIGGRHTRGGVFRVRSKSPLSENKVSPSDVDCVLSAPQPLAAWSRARWQPLAAKLGEQVFRAAALDTSRSTAERVRAIEVLTSQFTGVNDETAAALANDTDAEVVARLAWSLGRSSPSDERYRVLSSLTASTAPIVQRHAWEALASLPPLPTDLQPPPAWLAAFDSSSRRVRSAAIRVARTTGAANFGRTVNRDDITVSDAELSARQRLALLRTVAPPPGPDRVAHIAIHIAASDDLADVRLEAVRLIQLAAGDIDLEVGDDEIPGYVAAQPDELSRATISEVCRTLAGAFPSGDERLDAEIVRTLAMLAPDEADVLPKIAAKWTATSPSSRDVHYLIATSRIGGTRSDDVTAAIATAFVSLDGKLDAEAALPSRMWPRRVAQAFRTHLALEPRLSQAILAQPQFGDHAGHVLLANCFAEEPRQVAARLLIERLPDGDDENESAWTPDVVELVACLPDDEVLPVLRDHWDDARLADAITRVMAREPAPQDREHFVAALGSLNQATVSSAARAFGELDEREPAATATPDDVAVAIGAMRTSETAIAALAADDKEQPPAQAFTLVQGLDGLLARWTHEPVSSTLETAADVSAAVTRWQHWFTEHYPHDVALLSGASTNLAEWTARLDSIDWAAGDAVRGKTLFQQRGCQGCHGTTGRLGPELRGVTARLERDDLLAAIVDPSRDVAPTYHTWTVLTRSGQLLRGMLVYDSPASMLLETGPDTVVRVTGDDVLRQQPSTVSLMPTGLLDGLRDGDVADLFAYLKSLD